MKTKSTAADVVNVHVANLRRIAYELAKATYSRTYSDAIEAAAKEIERLERDVQALRPTPMGDAEIVATLNLYGVMGYTSWSSWRKGCHGRIAYGPSPGEEWLSDTEAEHLAYGLRQQSLDAARRGFEAKEAAIRTTTEGGDE